MLSMEIIDIEFLDKEWYNFRLALATVGQVLSHLVAGHGFKCSSRQEQEEVLFQLLLYLGCNIFAGTTVIVFSPFQV